MQYIQLRIIYNLIRDFNQEIWVLWDLILVFMLFSCIMMSIQQVIQTGFIFPSVVKLNILLKLLLWIMEKLDGLLTFTLESVSGSKAKIYGSDIPTMCSVKPIKYFTSKVENMKISTLFIFNINLNKIKEYSLHILLHILILISYSYSIQ